MTATSADVDDSNTLDGIFLLNSPSESVFPEMEMLFILPFIEAPFIGLPVIESLTVITMSLLSPLPLLSMLTSNNFKPNRAEGVG